MAYEMKQSAFRQDELQYPAILETLNTQIQQLAQLKYQREAKETEAVMETVEQLDFDLLRYVCAKFGHTLEEATREDCAQLIAVSATSPGQEQKYRDAWKAWLLAAPCWPTLAQFNWNYCLSRATDLVIEKLEKQDDLNLDGPEGREIIGSVKRLEISDLVTVEVYQEAYPESATEDEGEEML